MSDTPTPRTQAARCNVDTYADQYLFSHSTDGEWVRYEVTEQLERELAEVTKQRDALADALQWYEKKVSDCRKVTPEGHFARYKLDEDGGKIAAKALAATKGGSHE